MAKKDRPRADKLEDLFLGIGRILGEAAVRVDQAVQRSVRRFWLLELGEAKPSRWPALGPRRWARKPAGDDRESAPRSNESAPRSGESGPMRRPRGANGPVAPRSDHQRKSPQQKKTGHSVATPANSGVKEPRGAAKRERAPAVGVAHRSQGTGSTSLGRKAKRAGEKGGLIVKEMEGFAALKNGEIDRAIDMDAHAALQQSHGLDRIKKVRTRAALDDLLRGSQVSRAGALAAFRDLGPAVTPVLLASLGKVPREAGAELVKCLVETMDSSQLPALIAHLLENGDVQQRMIALAAVRRVDHTSARALLAKACLDPSSAIRRRVITCLSWYRTPWAIGLIKELAYDEDTGVRTAASEISTLVSRIGTHNRIEQA